ncbi:MAG: cytochrome C [Bacteroidota bacterium]
MTHPTKKLNNKKRPVKIWFFLNKLPVFIILLGLALIYGCQQQSQGFTLPPGGLEEGKLAFSTVGCDKCHSVGQIEWKGNNEDVHIRLGGKVASLKSYGELVTSIIHPNHKVARKHKDVAMDKMGISKMENFNQSMTVQELVDIVTFLQSEYELEPPDDYYHPY